ncbi:alginate lyase family protein [Paenibacillus dakarensis]|uniref:alginate lyase family protein n=1 Tax=Paenibacillus dakarensis TaxID=1527293 RepID=UPI001479261B|nr:alginate lyase family protein [Paenibacillus dakarensis]
MSYRTALELLLTEADESLLLDAHAVSSWEIPGFYMDAEGHWAAKLLMEKDAKTAYTTALAYHFTGTAAYANKVKDIIMVWAEVNKQIAGPDGPLVSAYLGVGLILAADWIKDFEGWSSSERNLFTDWLTQVCLPKWDQIPLRNNWWSWSIYAQLALYRFTEDKLHFAEEVSALKEHLDHSLSIEGFIPEEASRGKHSMWYHYFALAPVTAAAKLVLDTTSEDLFRWISPGGKSLQHAVGQFFHYADGHIKEWPYDEDPIFPEQPSASTWPLDLYEAMSIVYQNPDFERFVAPYRPIKGNTNLNSGFYHSYAWVYPELQFKA